MNAWILNAGNIGITVMILLFLPVCFQKRNGWAYAAYRTDFLQDSCSCSALHTLECNSYVLPVDQYGAGHVALSRQPSFYRRFYCQFTIQAPANMKVQITINEMSIPKTKSCKSAILKVFDGVPQEYTQWPMAGLCGSVPQERMYRSTRNSLTLYYYQGPDILWSQKRFNISYTYFRIPRKGLEMDKCNDTHEFSCKTGICVSHAVECDGYKNCDDGSDESLAYHVCGKYTRSDPVVGLSVGGTVAAVLLSALICTIIYRVRRKARLLDRPRSPSFPQNLANGNANIQRHSHISREDSCLVPDLTRDLPNSSEVGGDPSGSHPNNAVIGRLQNIDMRNGDLPSDVSSVDLNDLPPPAYSDLFPNHV